MVHQYKQQLPTQSEECGGDTSRCAFTQWEPSRAEQTAAEHQNWKTTTGALFSLQMRAGSHRAHGTDMKKTQWWTLHCLQHHLSFESLDWKQAHELRLICTGKCQRRYRSPTPLGLYQRGSLHPHPCLDVIGLDFRNTGISWVFLQTPRCRLKLLKSGERILYIVL